MNAVYFNAAWARKFHPEATKEASFTKMDGSKVPVSMMTEQTSRPYAKVLGYEAVELPYDGNELSMLVIAPTGGEFADFEWKNSPGEKVLEILGGLENKEVKLSFPKLKLEGAFTLKSPLQTLGMKEAFAPSADFSGISTTERLRVSDVIHKTFLDVDENGTEAAAATAVVVENTSAPMNVVTMTVDRPFLMAIVNRPTKTLVFLGRILEPKR